MWAPRAMDLTRIREVKGLEQIGNRAVVEPDPHVHPSLTHLSTVMEPAIEQVAENVYSAVGFDVANSTFVIGDDAVVIIDTMTSTENMNNAFTAFREICDYPVKGIVYTHSHGDHWGGSPAVIDAAPNQSAPVPIVAHDKFIAEVARINGYNQPIMAARSAYQHGAFLPTSVEGRVNAGAGPFLDFDQTAALIPPNVTVGERLDIEIAGVQMEIVWVPSEAPDEVAVWLPQYRVLQTAECIQGECFPNIYTLRGDVPRPAQQWIDSLDVLRRFPAEALAKSHGRSVVGASASGDHLRNYRDAIAWTHDQTIRFMNQGYVPDQIVEKLGAMPPHLTADETSGTEGYGSVPHGSRSIYTWYLGFNTGETTNFDPAPYERRQHGYVAAMGGAERVCELAREAMDRDDNRWAIELLGYVVRSQPDNGTARALSAQAHRREGFKKHNAPWRNWYLTAAEELEGRIPVPLAKSANDLLMGLPPASIMAGLRMRLRAELTWYVDETLVMEVMGDEPAAFSVHLRRGVLEVTEVSTQTPATEPEVVVRFADKAALVDYLIGVDLSELERGGRVEYDGDRDIAARFGDYFDPPPNAARILVTLHGPVPASTPEKPADDPGSAPQA